MRLEPLQVLLVIENKRTYYEEATGLEVTPYLQPVA